MELLIAERVRENRKRLGLTQEELAGRLGVSPQTVSYWENGGYPDITMLPVIANHFGITVDELMGNDTERIRKELDDFYLRSISGFAEKRFADARAMYAKYPSERQIQCILLQALQELSSERQNEFRELGREVAVKILSDPWTCPSDRDTAICCMARITEGEERRSWLFLLSDAVAWRKTYIEYSIVMRERGPEAANPYLAVDRIIAFRHALLSDLGNLVSPPEEILETRRFFLGIIESFGDGAIPDGWLNGAGGLHADTAFAFFSLGRKEEGYDTLRSSLDCFSRFAAFPGDAMLDVGAPHLFRGVKVGIKASRFWFPDGTPYYTNSFGAYPPPVYLSIRLHTPMKCTEPLREEGEFQRILSEADGLLSAQKREQVKKAFSGGAK